jgi:predicted secreted protein
MERSKKIVFELLELFSESDIGIVQIPCPQVEYNGGLSRRTGSKTHKEGAYKTFCKKLSSNILQQVEKYLKKNYDVVGILGVELSATCGVHQILNGSRSAPGKGILIEELEGAMRKKNFQVPLVGIDLNNMFSTVKKVHGLLKYLTYLVVFTSPVRSTSSSNSPIIVAA